MVKFLNYLLYFCSGLLLIALHVVLGIGFYEEVNNFDNLKVLFTAFIACLSVFSLDILIAWIYFDSKEW